MGGTDFMITFQTNIKPVCGRRAFTLVEVLIASSLGAFVLAGVLSSFLMLGRSGVNIANYSEMEAQVRRGMEEFAQDIRTASNVTWNSTTSITLTVPDNYASTANLVTYVYDNSSSGATSRCFYRMPGDATASNAKTIFIRNIVSGSFARFDRLNATTTTDPSTKRIQLSLMLRKSGSTLVDTSNIMISASYILRNKVAI